jgi:hypothetical protein
MKVGSAVVKEPEVILQTDVSEHTPRVSAAPATDVNERSLRAPGRLRILHFFTHLILGGTELTAIRMMHGLDKDLFENQICGIRGFDPKVTAFRCPDTEILSLPSDPTASRTQIFALREIIKRFRPHIVVGGVW